MQERAPSKSLIRRCVKDPFPGLSHWIGAILSVAALVVLIRAAHGRETYRIGFSIYGASLIVLYLASALNHSIHCGEAVADRLDQFDYSAIFVLIAGTYTPVCLITLHGRLGSGILAAEWIMAAVGVMDVWWGRKHSKWAHVVIYVVMGWLAIAVMVPLLRVFPAGAIAWLLAGGLAYSVGSVIFATNRPRLWPGIFEAHDLWHVLVLTGSACHFVMIYYFIA